MESTDRDRLERLARRAAREVAAVAIGFTVLGINRLQVERRRMQAACREHGSGPPGRA